MLALTIEPKHYPECCLSLSHGLFTCLTEIVCEVIKASQGEITILSVGCGTGFLEAALAAHLQEQNLSQTTRVEGVEVACADTRHLPSELVHRVRGTRDICRRAECADILMFVYPREGELVRQYCTQFVNCIRMVLWLGPRADFIAQQDLLHDINGFDGPVLLESTSLASYEIAVAYRSNAPIRIKQHDLIETEQHGLIWIEHQSSGIEVDSI